MEFSIYVGLQYISSKSQKFKVQSSKVQVYVLTLAGISYILIFLESNKSGNILISRNTKRIVKKYITKTIRLVILL